MSDEPNKPAEAGAEEPAGAAPAAPDPPAATPPAAEPQDDNKDRNYGIYVEKTLDVSSAAARKEAMEDLATLGHDGKLTVLARIGRAVASTPRKAIASYAEQVDLDGDYEVVAERARNKFAGVKTETKRSIKL